MEVPWVAIFWADAHIGLKKMASINGKTALLKKIIVVGNKFYGYVNNFFVKLFYEHKDMRL